MLTFKMLKKVFFGRVALFTFILLATVYYNIFVVNRDRFYNSLLQLATNTHDHYIYLRSIDLVNNGNTIFELANDKGIASIYVFLSEYLPFLVTPDMELISLVFNCFVLVLNYWLYGKLADSLGLGLFGRLSFFANLSLLYFAQLINKDMLTILIFLIAVNFGLRGRYWGLLLFIFIMPFIRFQLIAFILIFIFLSYPKRLWFNFAIVYISTSLFAAYLTVYFPIIGAESLGGGFSAYLVELNQRYFIGYLIFNPIRLLQYFFDAYRSFNIFAENGAIDVAKLLRLPQLVLLGVLSPYFFKLMKYWNTYSQTVAKPFVICILAFACTWLMNPTVNARYVMLITPIMILLSLYVRSTGKGGVHDRV